MDVTTIGSNALLFANLPPANQVSPGRVYRVSNVGPSPGIRMESNGTRWRPLGGSQVLAVSSIPITVQSLSSMTAVSLGPFPGGLVRAGMRLEAYTDFNHSGIGSGVRSTNGSINSATWWGTAHTASGASLVGNRFAALPIVSDTNASHPRWALSGVSFSSAVPQSTTLADFSAPWTYSILMQSAAETAVNLSGATWAGGIITFTAASHTLAVGDKTTVAGAAPVDYNDVYVVLSVPDANTFTVAHATDPGLYTSGGTSSRISNMILQSYVLSLVG